MEELKVTYEWYTPGGRCRRFWDTARGETQKIAIDNVKKVIKRRIRHECYKVIEIKFEKGRYEDVKNGSLHFYIM